jgi:hypothetical protein
MTADLFWEKWRTALQQRGLTLPLTPKAREMPILMELSEMADTDTLTAALSRYMALTNAERRKMHGAEIVTLAWFRTCLPTLLAEQQQDDTEKQKFLDKLNTYR